MKLPDSKRREIAKKGRSLPRKGKGGGAAGRVQQFQKQRGIRKKRPGDAGTGDKTRDDGGHGSSDE